MQNDHQSVFERNRQWAVEMKRERPDYFTRLLRQQTPKYMWIGCSDSRVPANQIMGVDPGEVFVHRNAANLVVHSDLNALSTIQFVVEHLKIKHVMAVGHHGCAGVCAAMAGDRVGLADNWLRPIQNIRDQHLQLLEKAPGLERADLLCELNVFTKVVNVCQSTVVRDAWERGQNLSVHAWVYGLQDGLRQDLKLSVSGLSAVRTPYAAAAQKAAERRRPHKPSQRAAPALEQG